ncbi:hypothetical protein R1sor_023977 [Riccia sorocarpa]|uniref:CCHC-type domain-containing protein n=1 Tax=Riccia sorocarpa TaxID=122646 RepID=A0ABD3GQQ6_9MARC
MQVEENLAGKCVFGGSDRKFSGRKREGARRESFVSRSIELPGRAKRSNLQTEANMAESGSSQSVKSATIGGSTDATAGPASGSTPAGGGNGGTQPTRSYAQATGGTTTNQHPRNQKPKRGGRIGSAEGTGANTPYGQDTLGRSKFSYVRALMLLNEEDEWPEAVLMETEDGKAEVEFELYYEQMPSGCFTCHKTGHLARFCPMTCKTRTVTDEELEAALKEAANQKESLSDDDMTEDEQEGEDIPDSQPTSSQPGPQKAAPILSANPYSALNQMEDKEESLPQPQLPDILMNIFDLKAAGGEPEEKKGGPGSAKVESQHQDIDSMDYTFRQKRPSRNSNEGTSQNQNLGHKEMGGTTEQAKRQHGGTQKKTKASQGDIQKNFGLRTQQSRRSI